MRISTAQFYETSTANYTRIYANVVATGNEVSSHVKLNTASDDPVGAARVLQLAQQSSMLGQYTSNINSATNNLNQTEAALTAIQTAVGSAQQAILGASNGTLTDADRKGYASTLTQLQGTILGLMNSKDASGQYLFGGSKSGTPPYSQNADGTFSYNGDQSSINVAIGNNLTSATNITGWDAFEKAINTTRTSTTLTAPAADDGKVKLSGGQVSDSNKFNASFNNGQPYTVSFVSSTQVRITDAGGNDVTSEASQGGKISSASGTNQTLSFRGLDLSLNLNLSTADQASGAASDAAVAGHTFKLAATPDTITTARSPGNPSTTNVSASVVTDQAAYNSAFPQGGAILKFSSPTAYDLYQSPITAGSKPVSSGTLTTNANGTFATAAGVTFTINGTPTPLAGDQFSVQGSAHQTQNLLDTLSSAITALSAPVDGNPQAQQTFQAAMGSAIGNLQSGLNQASDARSQVGVLGKAMEDQTTTNTSLQANNSNESNSITQSNPVDAIGRLTLQQTMLQASQMVFTQLSQLNLFNKLG